MTPWTGEPPPARGPDPIGALRIAAAACVFVGAAVVLLALAAFSHDGQYAVAGALAALFAVVTFSVAYTEGH